MKASIGSRLAALEDSIPRGYGSFDREGKPVIRSPLTAIKWFGAACDLFRSPGREEDKRVLREQLSASVGRDNGGGHLYEMVNAMFEGHGIETPALPIELSPVAGSASALPALCPKN